MKKLLYSLVGIAMLFSYQSTAQIAGCDNPVNLVTNGDFSTGVITPGNSNLTNSCGNCNTDRYCIGDDTHDKCNQKMFFTGNGNFMIIDGFTAGTGFQSFWRQNVTVQNGQAYNISFLVRDQYSTAGQADAEFFIRVVANGQVVGFSHDFQNAQWDTVSLSWTSNVSGSIVFDLQIDRVNGAGIATGFRDFAIDDIFFGFCDSEPCDVGAGFEYRQREGTCEWEFFNFSQAGNNDTHIVGYHWDFGDGSTSTDANPTHYYGQPGSYQVCLTTYAVNEAGVCCIDQECIEVESNCENGGCDIQGDFEISDLGSCTYSFNPFVISSNQIIGYFWNFGDGNTSTDPTPTHHYGSPGSYNVCLTVVAIDPDGECCTLYLCQEIDIDGDCPEPQEDPMDRTGTAVSGKASSPGAATDHFNLYPNPNDGVLNLELDNITGKAGNGSVFIFSSSGKLFEKMTQKITFDKGSNKLTLNTASLSPGLYVINIELNGQIFSKKFTKK